MPTKNNRWNLNFLFNPWRFEFLLCLVFCMCLYVYLGAPYVTMKDLKITQNLLKGLATKKFKLRDTWGSNRKLCMVYLGIIQGDT
jgi:hypothetical protein